MGPNTVTGHLSVIYTVECQINFTLRLLDPILKSLPAYRSRSFIPRVLAPSLATVEVKTEAAIADSQWTQAAAKKLVWASGCVNWAVDPKTGLNNSKIYIMELDSSARINMVSSDVSRLAVPLLAQEHILEKE